jgi:hypothetical protein
MRKLRSIVHGLGQTLSQNVYGFGEWSGPLFLGLITR